MFGSTSEPEQNLAAGDSEREGQYCRHAVVYEGPQWTKLLVNDWVNKALDTSLPSSKNAVRMFCIKRDMSILYDAHK